MNNSFSEKTKLLNYLREKKIRKDWLAKRLTETTGSNITAIVFSHYLHGRRDINNQFIETAISEILDVPRNEIF